MSGPARVESIDAIRAFRSALLKFAEMANTAMSDADGEMARTMVWLETEQLHYWQGQIRKRQELVNKAKDAVRAKKLFKDSSGRTPSAVDEEKALQVALRRLAEAEGKLVAVKQYTRRLEKEVGLYKGSVQRLATTIVSEIPNAASKLDAMIESLEAYVSLASQKDQGAMPATSSTTEDVASAMELDHKAASDTPQTDKPQ